MLTHGHRRPRPSPRPAPPGPPRRRATYRFNRFNEAITAAASSAATSTATATPPTCSASSTTRTTHDIWVDADQDHDFTDDALMRPYKENFAGRPLRHRQPGHRRREQMPFVVEFREDVDLAPAGLPGQSPTSSTSASSRPSTAPTSPASPPPTTCSATRNFDGAAPGREDRLRPRLHVGRRLHRGRAHRRHDRPGRQPRRRRRQHVDRRPARAQRRQQRPGPALQHADRRLRRAAVHLGRQLRPGHEHHRRPVGRHRRGQRRRRASPRRPGWPTTARVVDASDAMFNFSSRGPREDGGFKPNITAPGSAISTTPLWQPGGPVPEAGYALPAGLLDVERHVDGVPAGHRRGGAAAVGGQGDRQGASPRPQLRRAHLLLGQLRSSDVPAAAQGNGQFDVERRLGRCWPRACQPRTYTVDAPVCTADLAVPGRRPNRGTGIYNRCAADAGGQRPGQQKTYTVKVTRTSGPTWAVAAPDQLGRQRRHVRLAPAGPAAAEQDGRRSPVKAKPGAGVHSAIMEIDDLTTPLAIDFEMLNTRRRRRPTWPARRSPFTTERHGAAQRVQVVLRHRAGRARRRCR